MSGFFCPAGCLVQGMVELRPALVGCSDAPAAFTSMIDACWEALAGLRTWSFTVGRFAQSIKTEPKRAAPASWNISDAFKSSLNGAPLQRNCFSRSAALTGGKKGSGRNNCCRPGAGAAEAAQSALGLTVAW